MAALPSPTPSSAPDAARWALLAAMHAVPRYDASLRRAPADFSLPPTATAAAYAASPYLQGVLLQAGGVWALAALFLVVFGVAFAAACCCRRRLPKGFGGGEPSAYARGVACCCSGRNCYFVAATAFACGLAAALAYTTTFFAGVGDLIAGLAGLRATLGAAAATVGGALLGNLTAADALARGAQALAAGSPLAPDADALAAAAAGAVAVAVGAQASLNATVAALATDLGVAVDAGAAGVPAAAQALVPGRLDLGAARAGLTNGSLALLSLALAWLALHACLLRASPCAARSFRLAAPVSLLAAVLVTALAGVAYVPALVGSDVCAAPGASVAALLNATAGQRGADAAATVLYYSACALPGPGGAALAPAGALAQAVQAQAALAEAQSRLAAFAAAGAGANASFAALLGGLNATLLGSGGALAALVDQVSCAPVAADWALALDGLCLGAVFGVSALAVSLGAGAALLALLLAATAHVLRNHPGDLRADAEEAAKRSSLDRVASALRTVDSADDALGAGIGYQPPPANSGGGGSGGGNSRALGVARARSVVAGGGGGGGGAGGIAPGALLARGAAPTYQAVRDYR